MLAVLKNNHPLILETDILYPDTFYRKCLWGGAWLVHGISFSQEEFDANFEDAHKRILRDFKTLSLVKGDNTPISKSEFNRKADIHTYGRKYKVVYFHNIEVGRKLIYGFFVNSTNNKDAINEAYVDYKLILSGDLECVDNKRVQFGNNGIPLVYSALKVS